MLFCIKVCIFLKFPLSEHNTIFWGKNLGIILLISECEQAHYLWQTKLKLMMPQKEYAGSDQMCPAKEHVQ